MTQEQRTIFCYDHASSTFIELKDFLPRIDEYRSRQIARLAERLERDGKLEGPNIDYHGDQTWRVSIVNEKNTYELHLLRLGEEKPRKFPDFRDTFKGPEDLKSLNVVIEEKLHPDFHRWNPLAQTYYNTERSVPLDEYFRLNNYLLGEQLEVKNLISNVFRRIPTDGVYEFSPFRYRIEALLSSGRYVQLVVRVI